MNGLVREPLEVVDLAAGEVETQVGWLTTRLKAAPPEAFLVAG
jgi:hypothetical protein